jgi:hypothetical protein
MEQKYDVLMRPKRRLRQGRRFAADALILPDLHAAA